jgi:beta-N-acetylhexosaminidase
MNIDRSDLDSLTLEQRVGQLFFIGVPGPAFDEETKGILRDVSPGGVCLFSRNIIDAAGASGLLDKIASFLPIPPLLSLDQEGGLVDRLRRVLAPMPEPSIFKDRDHVRQFAAIVSETVRRLGFNMNFAPVVDVVDGERTLLVNGLYSRTFGRTSYEVIDLAGTFLREMQAGGCLGCVKHFPGLGAAASDSHEELPAVNIDAATFNDVDLAPYRELISSGDARAVMVAHATYPGIDLQEGDRNGRLLPCSLSRNFVTLLLRDELGFSGVAISDDMEMGAIVKNYGIGEACKMAILAGIDMIAICASPKAIREGYRAVLEGVQSGEIPERRVAKSLTRIASLKSARSDRLKFDDVRLREISDQITSLADTIK